MVANLRMGYRKLGSSFLLLAELASCAKRPTPAPVSAEQPSTSVVSAAAPRALASGTTESDVSRERYLRVSAPTEDLDIRKVVDRAALALPEPPWDENLQGYFLPAEIVEAQLVGVIIDRGAPAPAPAPAPTVDPAVARKSKSGDFLARIWSIYGPPGSGGAFDRFEYVFIDRETKLLFTAYSAQSGPSYGGAYTYDGPWPPPASYAPHLHARWDRTQLLATVRGFEALLERAPLADCLLLQHVDEGLMRIGARDGKVLPVDMTFGEQIDFYADWIRREGPYPKGNVPEFLRNPGAQVRELWLEFSDERDRKERPDALEMARDSWRRDLARLRAGEVDAEEWEIVWSELDEQAERLGLASRASRRALDAVRKPPQR
jgi:hypothetical protein